MKTNSPSPYANDVETIPLDEAEDIQQVVVVMRQLLARSHSQSGEFRRDVHVKMHGGAQAEFRVAPNLPDDLSQGLFENVAAYAASFAWRSRHDISDSN
jgi:hypothetical protein